MPKQSRNSKIDMVQKDDFVIDGKPGYIIEYVDKYQDTFKEPILYKTQRRIIIFTIVKFGDMENKMFYRLGYYADEINHEKYFPIFKYMVESFHIGVINKQSINSDTQNESAQVPEPNKESKENKDNIQHEEQQDNKDKLSINYAATGVAGYGGSTFITVSNCKFVYEVQKSDRDDRILLMMEADKKLLEERGQDTSEIQKRIQNKKADENISGFLDNHQISELVNLIIQNDFFNITLKEPFVTNRDHYSKHSLSISLGEKSNTLSWYSGNISAEAEVRQILDLIWHMKDRLSQTEKNR